MKTTTVEWMHDPYVDDTLKETGLTADFVEVSVSEFDEKASLSNKARRNAPIYEPHVDDLCEKMMAGERFYAGVAVKLPNGRLKMLSGNHRRLAAKKKGDKTVWVYLVDTSSGTSDDIFDILPSRLNRPTVYDAVDSEQGMSKAIEYMLAGKQTLQQAAEYWRVKLENLRVQFKHRSVLVLAEKNGVDMSKYALSKTVLARVNEIALDSVKVAACRVASMGDFKKEQIDELVGRVNRRSGSEASQMTVIAEHEQALGLARKSDKSEETTGREETTYTSQKRPLRTKTLYMLTQMMTTLKGKKKLRDLDFTAEDSKRDEVLMKMEHVKKALHVIIVNAREKGA